MCREPGLRAQTIDRSSVFLRKSPAAGLVCGGAPLEHVAGIEIQDSQLAYDVLPFC